MTKPAVIKGRGRKLVWACPTCGKTLGEVYDGTVVVRFFNRMITFPTSAPVQQVCPSCAEVSLLEIQENAA